MVRQNLIHLTYRASLNNLKIIMPDEYEHIQPESYIELLNASLVYLCYKDDSPDSPVLCHGIGNYANLLIVSPCKTNLKLIQFSGIVRAVNKLTNDVYLVSSVGLQDLVNVNALAFSAIPLPSAVLLNQHSLVRGYVPFVYNTDNFVGSKQVAQHVYKVQGYNRI